ncbi:DUF4328 domain-containing protein [Actinoplanes sp. NEAU-A12]|uniref:DUF4328 domain-containing protein n=1 Tax=Actinoplanes sandaracinus TaxID=3045177 RepID=A0ABT6WUI1_9ACTN|nr:DUF4328 domain-containing protein [Actinoplanes sandaracinus]MDI6103354.1 DUF4328 domain-containing protein [Actinoplanes sandaracinus]
MNASLGSSAAGVPAPWPAARLAMAGMRACAVITVIDLLLVGAKYEDRVGWVTHDAPAVAVLGFLAALIELAAPLNTVLVATGILWALTALATAVAFLVWLVRAARNADRLNGRPRRAHGWAIGGWLIPVANLVIPYRVVQGVNAASAAGPGPEPAPVGRWWAALLVTFPLVVAGAVCREGVVGYEIGGQQLRDTRVLAYLLWAVAAAAVWYSAALGRKVVRRITEAQATRTHQSAG